MASLLLAVIYAAFISLGLPDSLLGSAWPRIYTELNVPVSASGFIAMIISALNSERLIKRFGTNCVTLVSVILTCIALFGFSFSHRYALLCLFAVPYGLGAGSIDVALNNYVAVHYSNRQMSWLHAMWGVGAAVGPVVMSWSITRFDSWNTGYRIIGFIQIVIAAILFVSLPLWNKVHPRVLKKDIEDLEEEREEFEGERAEGKSVKEAEKAMDDANRPILLKEILRVPGVIEIGLCYFCYSSLETTSMLWASTYLVKAHGISVATAAFFGSLFVAGITVGRMLVGFLPESVGDTTRVRAGQIVCMIALILMFIPSSVLPLIGLVLLGLGAAPIYPSLIHAVPDFFGSTKSQAVIGFQMAAGYTAATLMPTCFGLLANNAGLTMNFFPIFMVIAMGAMIVMHERSLCSKS